MGRRRPTKAELTTTTGIVCASKHECNVVQELINSGVDFEYEPETISYRTKVRNGTCDSCGESDVYQERSYTPDIRFANGIYLEVKGKFTPQKRTLMRAFVKCNPELDLRFVFQNNGYLTKAKKTSFVEWAHQIGCEATVGKAVPSQWYDQVGSDGRGVSDGNGGGA